MTQNEFDTPSASKAFFPAGIGGLLCLPALARTCLLAAACMLALGCGEDGPRATTTPSSAHDAELSAPTIVSLSPTGTRFIEALGARDLLVGVDPASSQSLSGRPLPEVDLQGALQLAPDLILVDELPRPKATAQPSSGPAEYVEFAPHGLEELFALSRTLGKRLVGPARATRFELGIARPLAQVGGSEFKGARPRVAAVLSLDPIRLAGGHSFTTDLIEIGGGNSVTHEANQDDDFVPQDADWRRLAPNLVLVPSSRAMSPREQAAVRTALPADYPVLFFPFDPELFWLEEPAETARRLRILLQAHTQEHGASGENALR